MSLREFVDDVLCVPVTRVGYKYLVEAMELVLDTHEHKFYDKLSDILQVSTRYLEKAMRDAKNISLISMDDNKKQEIFGNTGTQTVTEYVIKCAEYYRRCYEIKET